MPKPAAQVLLERYWEEVNNQGNLELIRELCSDPITRHDPGGVTVLSHDEQIERVRDDIEQPGVQISRVITHADEVVVIADSQQPAQGAEAVADRGRPVLHSISSVWARGTLT